MSKRTVASLLVVGLSLALPGVADAKPTAPAILCSTFPDSAACVGRVAECATCHTSTDPAAWNAYGLDVLDALDGEFEQDLPRVLASLQTVDSDEDALSNEQELAMGTNPGFDDAEAVCESSPSGEIPASYDYQLARRRVGVLYCGRTPSYQQMQEFRESDGDAAALEQRLQDALNECLASDYWRDEGLARIADELIRPVSSVGQDSTIGIKLADYAFDYRLFAYVLTGDRDARELLTADYHVTANEDGELTVVEGPVQAEDGNGDEPLAASQRAGMITTKWFLVINTMFSALPRTTAAQAYRAYLGQDIALQQGILPVAAEPVDVDDKGVDADACAQCHSTLDPLAYAFASYEGIKGSKSGLFDAERPARDIPGWEDNQSWLLGEPVDNVVAWAKVASDSDMFLRNLASLFFRHAMGRRPQPGDEPELQSAFLAMRDDGYSANALIHRLILLPAFGGVR